MPLISFINPASKYKYFNLVWLFLLLIFPIILWLLPSTFFDDTKYEVCPSKLFFNQECLGCGMTRAVMHLHHLDWRDAIYFNLGVVVIYPLLVVVWIYWIYLAKKRFDNQFKKINLQKDKNLSS